MRSESCHTAAEDGTPQTGSARLKQRIDRAMSREKLLEIARHNLAHHRAGTIEQAPGVFRIPAQAYTAPQQFQREVDLIFKRLPVVLAPSAELPKAGDYKAMAPMGVPLLLTRDKQSKVHVFLNACGHRGCPLKEAGTTGQGSRFVCPYHGWTYTNEGTLMGVAAAEDFGEFDRSEYALPELPAMERSGLIWGILDPKSTLDMDGFLCGYDEMLDDFGFADWYLFDSRTLRGPNWKIAYDGYLDLYHLPVLHKNTIGGTRTAQANYYGWGPHQHTVSPERFSVFEGRPESDWTNEEMITGVWTIFPHVSIASFNGGGRGAMISQLFPGASVGESYTTQYYVMEKVPDEETRIGARQQFDLLEKVVLDEDYKTGLLVQEALAAGARTHSLFGRNELGGQVFHGWVERILNTPDDGLDALFRPDARQAAE